MYPENWHSQYYAAFIYIELTNFSAKKNKDKWCDVAEKYLNKAIKIRKNDSENYVLKAYLLSARIKVNPMFRVASMGKESKEFLKLAIKNNSNNPRAYYIRGMGIFNTPSIFGGGKKKAKPYLDKSLELYKTFSSKSEIDPKWGEKNSKNF